MWSRSRQFSPSLPDRWLTQGRGPTGIWNLAQCIREPKTSGKLVMVRRCSATSRGIIYSFPFRLRLREFFVPYCLLSSSRKNGITEMEKTTSLIQGLHDFSSYVTELKLCRKQKFKQDLETTKWSEMYRRTERSKRIQCLTADWNKGGYSFGIPNMKHPLLFSVYKRCHDKIHIIFQGCVFICTTRTILF